MDYLLGGGATIALNLGTGAGVTVRQVIETVRTVAGREVPVCDALRRPGDPAMLVADPKLAREVLGWAAEQSDVGTIISDAWRWHRKRFGNAAPDGRST